MSEHTINTHLFASSIDRSVGAGAARSSRAQAWSVVPGPAVWPAAVAVALLVFLSAGRAEAGGTWSDPGTSVFTGNATADYTADIDFGAGCVPDICSKACDDDVPPGNCPLNGFIPNAFGWDFGRWAHAECDQQNLPGCPRTESESQAWTVVGGVGTSTAQIKWSIDADTQRNCDACIPYNINADADLNTTINLTIDTVPPGEAVDVYLAWWAVVNRWTECEAAGDDPAGIDGPPGAVPNTATLSFAVNNAPPTPLIAGVNVLDACNGPIPPNAPNAILFFPATPGLSTGVIPAHGGDTITINITGSAHATVSNGANEFKDQAWAHYQGQVLLSIDDPLPPFQNPSVPGASVNEFSVKIGSDTEMSDNTLDGNEVFEPGDTYPWFAPSLPVCGDDGVRDDALAFALDYAPQTPDCIADPQQGGTGAETCTVTLNNFDPTILNDRFDLDGTDALDVALWPSLIPSSSQPLDQPISQFASDCMYGPDPYLLISYADDLPHHYAVDLCQIPTESPSSTSQTYGSDSNEDEVMMVSTTFSLSAPQQVNFSAAAPVHSEASLHSSLAPSPDLNAPDPQVFDDDVDALDVNVNNTGQCEHWYISADKEATGVYQNIPLDPASIYQVLAAGGLVKVIDGQAHLGLPTGTDLNAFEFVWLRQCDPADPTSCQVVLGMLFSVDEFDGFGALDLMPGDETGGLDPRKIYASYLDGAHFEYATDVLDDNVDAIAASSLPFAQPTPVNTENESCGADANGGCNSSPAAFEPMACGDTIAGTAWADGGLRDTDWYEFTINQSSQITATLSSEFPGVVGLLDATNCNTPIVLAFGSADNSQVISPAGACLGPGTYVVFVATGHPDGSAVLNGYPCGSGDNDYVVSLSCVPTSCAQCGDQAAGDCCSANGTPFCDDADCCNAVCAIDPFCCQTEWDQLCADQAQQTCARGVSQLLQMLSNWGPCPNPCPPSCAWDLNGNCNVGISDLLILLSQWGQCP